MPLNRPPTNFPKRPVRRIRLPKIGPGDTKGFFEEYFYGCLVAVFLVTAILMKAGGMSTYKALVLGLWAACIVWFARQARLYFKEGAKAEKKNKPTPTTKPIMEPQWAAKPAQAQFMQSSPAAGSNTNNNQSKPAFVYERPTLPGRKPKLPANWPGAPGKKPKR